MSGFHPNGEAGRERPFFSDQLPKSTNKMNPDLEIKNNEILCPGGVFIVGQSAKE